MSPRFSVDSTKILSHCAPFCPDLACGTGTAQAGGNRQDRVERDERRSGQRRGIFYPCVPCPSCPFRSVLHRSLSAVPAASPSGSRDSEDLWILLLLLYFFFSFLFFRLLLSFGEDSSRQRRRVTAYRRMQVTWQKRSLRARSEAILVKGENKRNKKMRVARGWREREGYKNT